MSLATKNILPNAGFPGNDLKQYYMGAGSAGVMPNILSSVSQTGARRMNVWYRFIFTGIENNKYFKISIQGILQTNCQHNEEMHLKFYPAGHPAGLLPDTAPLPEQGEDHTMMPEQSRAAALTSRMGYHSNYEIQGFHVVKGVFCYSLCELN